MTEPWHIPRASIGSISTQSVSNSSNSSSSGSRKNSYHHPRRSSLDERTHIAYFNRGYQCGTDSSGRSGSLKLERQNSINNINNNISSSNGNNHNNQIKENGRHLKRRESSVEMKSKLDELRNRFDDSMMGGRKKSDLAPKRGSRSSQGSTDSNHSSHSASSGSLLLTAANLENFARIHQKMGRHSYIKEEDGNDISAYVANITLNPEIKLTEADGKRVPDIDAITIDMPPDVFLSKLHAGMGRTKDFDSMSLASSTHFTVVNGIGRPPKVPKSSLCDRGHQITVLIMTMSIFFMIGISAAVYYMEMRAREMPY